jgi:DNA-binding response OmpR family regulator
MRKMDKKILIIDDDKMILKLSDYVLKDEYEVKCATSGFDGIDLAESFLPDLILLDIEMPQMNGFEVMQALNKSDKCKNIPILMFTSSADRETVLKAKNYGVNDYIVKPFLPEKLLESVEKTLGRNAHK